MATSVPVPKKVYKIATNVPNLFEVEASNPIDAIRKARQVVDVNVDIFNNNGGYGYGMFHL